MSVLLIADAEKTAIRHALERAAQHPISVETLRQWQAPDKAHLKLTDRPKGAPTIPQRSQHVDLPIGYRAVISFEQQPQPMGLCKHLSISVERKGFLPSPEAVKAIAQEFGVIWPDIAVHMWIEEFEPGHNAINLLAPVGLTEGHA